MTDHPTFGEVPESIRGLMKTSVEQARNAFNAVVSSSERFVQGLNTVPLPATASLRAYNEKVAAFTRQNAEANFNFASRLAEVRQVSDMVELQNSYLRQQMETYNRQLEELRELTMQIVKDGTQGMGPR